VESLTGAALPTTFFVAAEARLQECPERFQAFTRAFDAAVRAMRHDETLWREGAGNAAVNGHARPLREAWLRRVRLEWPDRLPHRLTHCFEILKTRLGHEVPGLDALPDGSFSADFLAVGDVTA
jgi:NitT/TauT family transport system substrate-binding protein